MNNSYNRINNIHIDKEKTPKRFVYFYFPNIAIFDLLPT